MSTEGEHGQAVDPPITGTRPVPTGRGPWTTRIVLGLVALVVLAVGVALGITVLPRWWAHRVGAVADGSLTAGIFAGLTCGVVFTAAPLILLTRVIARHGGWRGRLVWFLLAVVAAVPNLTTLGIVLGNGDAAHAGERTMDVEAPGFRGATLVGAVIGALLVVATSVLLVGRRRRMHELDRLRADLKLRNEQQPQQGPAKPDTEG